MTYKFDLAKGFNNKIVEGLLNLNYDDHNESS